MATLHFIYGFPGSGKTKLARELAAKEPAVLFVEDEWILALTPAAIESLDQLVDITTRIRRVIAPLARQLLAMGTSVVFDFAANTPASRAWVRMILEATSCDHVLHLLDVPAEECKRRLHERNEAKPEGLYFGPVSDELFDSVLQHIQPPSESEGFVIRFHAVEAGELETP